MKLSHGFRSRFEFEFAQYLAKNKIKYEYEKDKFRYILPIKIYTPDFYLVEYGFHLELKGHLDVVARVKYFLILKRRYTKAVKLHMLIGVTGMVFYMQIIGYQVNG